MIAADNEGQLRMRVAILAETYSKNMGYSENGLPKAMARLGAEVHLITLDLPPYYNLPDFQRTYGAFTGMTEKHPTIENVDGYVVHYLPHRRILGYMRMEGMFKKLRTLRPNIVQTFAAISWIPLDAALAEPRLRYKLFTGNHTVASTFPLARQQTAIWNKQRLTALFTRAVPGRLISLATEKCYAVTGDAAEIAVRFFGVPRNKVQVMFLGVDTDYFFPISSAAHQEEREGIRNQLRIKDSDILCIYTGKMTLEKNALILAQAIAGLRAQGEPYAGLFIGDGVQRTDIEKEDGCFVRPFMPFQELGPFYRAADIGVWPSLESTSILDAAACGLPLIVSDTIYREPVEGNGLVYRLNDRDDLVRALRQLGDAEERRRLGQFGAAKMARDFSWLSIARRRLQDYKAALGHEHSPGK